MLGAENSLQDSSLHFASLRAKMLSHTRLGTKGFSPRSTNDSHRRQERPSCTIQVEASSACIIERTLASTVLRDGADEGLKDPQPMAG